jgi:hypothetical protein
MSDNQSPWISIHESLPEIEQQVLSCFKGQFAWVMFVATMTRNNGLYAAGYAAPTHWMPLPEPPKEPVDVG